MGDDFEAGDADSAMQPRAGTLHLQELNSGSAPCWKWDIGIFKPRIEQWTNPKNGKLGAAFRCILVSLTDPKHYVEAKVTLRSGDMKALYKVENTFKSNLLFT